jgi:PAS domain-containing protein
MPSDLSGLPAEVVETARVDDNGEVSWRDIDTGAALESLAEAGRVILGLDVRFYDADGKFYEIAWTAFRSDEKLDEASTVRRALDDARTGLARIDELEPPDDTVERRVLVTWR